MIGDIDFKKEFLNIDFDSVLIDHDNPLINSYEYYIQYKQKYILETKKNFDAYQKLTKEYKKYKNQYQSPSNNRLVFSYRDEENVAYLSQQIKKLIVDQRKILSNFQHYVSHLNDDQMIYMSTANNKKSTIRRNKNIFTRLLDSNKEAKIRRRTPTT